VYQICTLEVFPRQPEHCIVWVKEALWTKERPGESVDGDNDEHIAWIYEKSIARAAEYKIEGVTVSLTKGVVKGIVPAIAATQAIIASMCVTEALKAITQCAPVIDNNLMFNGQRGALLHNFRYDRDPKCPACSRKFMKIPGVEGETVQGLLERLAKDFKYPATSLSVDGNQVYLPIVAGTRENLTKPIAEFAGAGSALVANARGRDTQFEFELA
jgi:ubiquitin-activating enzyme E1 C